MLGAIVRDTGMLAGGCKGNSDAVERDWGPLSDPDPVGDARQPGQLAVHRVQLR